MFILELHGTPENSPIAKNRPAAYGVGQWLNTHYTDKGYDTPGNHLIYKLLEYNYSEIYKGAKPLKTFLAFITNIISNAIKLPFSILAIIAMLILIDQCHADSPLAILIINDESSYFRKLMVFVSFYLNVKIQI